MRKKYTPEEHDFLRSYIPNHTCKEISKAFYEKFGVELTEDKVKSYMSNHKLKNGLTGRFKKGNVPQNKGKKMSPEVYEKIKSTMFKKGSTPHNHKPVGTEVINRDGYIMIKVEEPNKWKLKHRLVYEQHIGKSIPKDKVVVFLDQDKTNCNFDNLILVERKYHVIMNHLNLYRNDKALSEVGINLAKLIHVTTTKNKELNK